MKKLIIIAFMLLPLTAFIAKADDQRLVNEINSISLNDSKTHLIVKGWGFIMNSQHHRNNSTHQYQLILKSKRDTIYVDGRQQNISHTETMKYVGSSFCGNGEYRKQSNQCNYNYDNIGFLFEIPLYKLKMEEDYVVSLHVKTLQSNISKTVEVYFPNKEIINLNNKHDHYIIDSKLYNVGAKILNSWVVVRSGPGKSSPNLTISNGCSANKNLYYKADTVFKTIFDKSFLNNTTYYQLKGAHSGCEGGINVVSEGNQYSPIWIASTFIDHVGEALTIKTRQINTPPTLNVGNDIVKYHDETVDIWEGVSAYDQEDGDLSEDIKIIKNNYTAEPGSYEVHFSVTDSFEKTVTKIRNITILKRNYPPTITTEDVILKQFSSYNPYLYATAVDQDKNDITRLIEAKHYIDTHEPGVYEQCYFVKDSSNLTDEKCSRVTVEPYNFSLRFIQKKRLFYKEDIPMVWVDKEDIIQEQLNNDLVYDMFTLND